MVGHPGFGFCSFPNPLRRIAGMVYMKRWFPNPQKSIQTHFEKIDFFCIGDFNLSKRKSNTFGISVGLNCTSCRSLANPVTRVEILDRFSNMDLCGFENQAIFEPILLPLFLWILRKSLCRDIRWGAKNTWVTITQNFQKWTYVGLEINASYANGLRRKRLRSRIFVF